MATLEGPPFPARSEIATETTNAIGNRVLTITKEWSTWFRGLRAAVDSAQISIPVAPVATGTGSLPVTAIDGGVLTAGLFAVSWYLEILTAAAGRSLQVTIAWVSLGVPRSYVGAILDGSVSTNSQPNEHLTIYSDAASPITYSINYVGAVGMTYNFRPVLQSVTLS